LRVGILTILAAGAVVCAAAARPSKGAVVKVVVGAHAEMRFEPAALTVHRGDVIRFVAANGVHDVHFLPERNPGAKKLPAASDYLLRDGDVYELKVELAPGTYEFQCDPHASMGMKGKLTVVE
jgi:plastocyanin